MPTSVLRTPGASRLRSLGLTAPVKLVEAKPSDVPAVLSQRLTESFFGAMTPFGYPMVWQAYQNTSFPGPGGFPYRGASGTTNDRAYGKDLPFFWSEVDLRGYRVTSRYLAETNPFAIGFCNLLVSYHIGKGYGWQACRKGAKKTAYATGGASEDPLIEKAQRILDEFRDRNQWGVLSGEAFYRWRVDGEVFLEVGQDDENGIWCRFVEPEQVGAPDGSTTDPWSYGIEVYEYPDGKIDPMRILSYHVWDLESGMTGGRWLDAPYMVHAKANVVSNVKRGRPDFFPVLDLFDGARKLWSNMLSSAVRQAAYAWLEQFPTATAAQVGGHIPAFSTGTGTSIPANQAQPQVVTGLPWWGQGQRNIEPPGTIMRIEGNRAVVPMPADGRAAGFELIVKLIMRTARAIWSLPGAASGDAEDTTFAAAIQAGGPFPVTVGRSQLKWGDQFEKPTALKVLDLAVAAGKLTREERAALDVQTTAPAVVTPEPDKEAGTRLSKVQAGLLSKTTAILEDGKDPQHEFANMEAEKKRDAAQVPSPGASTDPNAPPADSQGGDFDASSIFESTDPDPFTALLDGLDSEPDDDEEDDSDEEVEYDVTHAALESLGIDQHEDGPATESGGYGNSVPPTRILTEKHGNPPFPGAVFDTTKRRWVKPTTAGAGKRVAARALPVPGPRRDKALKSIGKTIAKTGKAPAGSGPIGRVWNRIKAAGYGMVPGGVKRFVRAAKMVANDPRGLKSVGAWAGALNSYFNGVRPIARPVAKAKTPAPQPTAQNTKAAAVAMANVPEAKKHGAVARIAERAKTAAGKAVLSRVDAWADAQAEKHAAKVAKHLGLSQEAARFVLGAAIKLLAKQGAKAAATLVGAGGKTVTIRGPKATESIFSEEGQPPFPGAVFNRTSHRWEKPGGSGSGSEPPAKTAAPSPEQLTTAHKSLAAAMPELPPDQFEAMGDYTSGAYTEINQSLREGRAATKAAAAIPHIVAAIDSAPTLTEPVTVYRGLRMTADQAGKFLARVSQAKEAGELIEEPAFMSTSINPAVATGFASGGSGSESPVVFQISARKGLYLGESVGGTKEMELVLQRGSKFRVVGVEGRTVHLEQVL